MLCRAAIIHHQITYFTSPFLRVFIMHPQQRVWRHHITFTACISNQRVFHIIIEVEFHTMKSMYHLPRHFTPTAPLVCIKMVWTRWPWHPSLCHETYDVLSCPVMPHLLFFISSQASSCINSFVWILVFCCVRFISLKGSGSEWSLTRLKERMTDLSAMSAILIVSPTSGSL